MRLDSSSRVFFSTLDMAATQGGARSSEAIHDLAARCHASTVRSIVRKPDTAQFPPLPPLTEPRTTFGDCATLTGMHIHRTATALLLAAAAVALASCAAATKMAEPTPDPPSPSLLGTWQAVVEDGHATETLTFRRDGRWVLVTVKRDEAGEVEDQYAAQGGWEQTATTIAKTWHPWDDETDLPAVEPLTAAKRYTLTANTLTVQRWPEDEPDSPDVTMRRVTDAATLPSLAGDWVREEFNEAGDLERRWTITATDAGFTYTFSDSNGKFEMTDRPGPTTRRIRSFGWC